jgi:probable F420-dependent oxidoreductase
MGPALVAAAEATSTLRVGSLVYDVDFRHPALLAKEAASIDLLTDGRFELGLGAGWMLSDYQKTGMLFERPPVRAERFGEAVQIIKGLFADRPFTLEGKHFRVTDLDGLPKPVQKPRMPIVVGAGGPKMLSLAAREADIISVLMQSLPEGGLNWRNATPEAFDDKLDRIRSAASDRYSTLEINLLMQKTVVTADRAGAADDLSRAWGIPADAVLACPLALIGQPDQICDELEQRRRRWAASYVCVFAESMESFAPVVKRLARK